MNDICLSLNPGPGDRNAQPRIDQAVSTALLESPQSGLPQTRFSQRPLSLSSSLTLYHEKFLLSEIKDLSVLACSYQ